MRSTGPLIESEDGGRGFVDSSHITDEPRKPWPAVGPVRSPIGHCGGAIAHRNARSAVTSPNRHVEGRQLRGSPESAKLGPFATVLSAPQVWGPTTPSALMRSHRWNSRTVASVIDLNEPSWVSGSS